MATFIDIGFGVDVVQLLFSDHASGSLNSDADSLKVKSSSENFNRVSLIKSGKEIDS